MSVPEDVDPFDTAGRRAAVFEAWRSSPTRFREDANAEEDLVLGGYADRLLVELMQNAADAAARDGTPGRLRLQLLSTPDGPVLSAANTGAALDAPGVDSLTSLRASAKRDDGSVGRFGVGFSAVLAVSDEPELRSVDGGVRFSAATTRAAVESVGHLRDETARRDGRVPVLRLAWPATGPPPPGFVSEVRLPLRDDAATAAVRTALDSFDVALMLSFPQLSTVELAGRVVTRSVEGVGPDMVLLTVDGVGARWHVRHAGGRLPAALLTDRPVEERLRDRWSMLAAVPVDDRGPVPLRDQVVHAPTPSDEPLDQPVRLVGSFPLDPARRRVPPGALTDWLVARAAAVIGDLVAAEASAPSVLPLLPAPGFRSARLAAALADAVRDELRGRELLPAAGGGRTRPERALAVPDPLVDPLTGVLDGLLPEGWWGRDSAATLASLGVRMVTIAEVVAAVSGVQRPPSWWRSLYAGLAGCALEAADREALAALPVPVADGRTVTGPARVLLPGPEQLPPLDALGLLLVHPDAAHPLLERLGAVPASPLGVLRDDRVRAAVTHSLDEEDPAPVAAAVLFLAGAAGPDPGSEPWLAELALPGRSLDGTERGWYPAGDLLLSDGPLPELFSVDSPFGVVDDDMVDSYGRAALIAVGVLDTFAVLEETHVDVADVAELDLDGAGDWAVALRGSVGGVDPLGLRVERVRAVRDLEWVRPDRWREALELLATGPSRGALVGGCHVVTATGQRVAVPGYTRWWLARRPVLGGRRPTECRTAGESELAGLYEEAPGSPDVAALLGAHRGLADLLTDVAADPGLAVDLLDRLGDPERSVVPELLAVIYPRLAAALAGRMAPPPDRIRVAPDRVVTADEAVVLDQPWLLDRLGGRWPVPAGAEPVSVADLLDLPLLSELPPPGGGG